MKKTTNATCGIDKGELVQVALLPIHGGDGAYLSVLLGSLIGVSLVHFFLIFQCYIPILPISVELFRQWTVGVIFLC